MNKINKLFPKSKQRRCIAITSLEIFESLKAYLPLTVRQVYYQLVSVGTVDNHKNQYKKVSEVLKLMRENELFPYSYITDRSRRTIDKRGITDIQVFVNEQVRSLFDPRYYHRCKVQDQQWYIEITTEKDALSAVVEEAVWPYCCRVNIVRGQSSATQVEEMAQRFRKASDNGQYPAIIHIGDFDPSGCCIPLSIQKSLNDTHGVPVHLDISALNQYQIIEYDLPRSMESAKVTDPNYKKWINTYGAKARPVEVDALHPRDLQNIITSSIEKYLDMDSFSEQDNIETKERKQLKLMRLDTLHYLNSQYPVFKINKYS